MKLSPRTAAAACALMVLTSCGGGGDDDRCASDTVLSVNWSYSQPRLTFPINKTTSYTPVITGLPAACASQKSFRMVTGPAFLSIDASTGVITGTPLPSFVCVNTPVGTTGGCSTSAEFRMAIPGFSEVLIRPFVDVTAATTP